MTACPPVYSLIYILCTKKLLCNETITIGDLAKQFNITQGDVVNAWQHWQEQGLVNIHGTAETDLQIEFLPIDIPINAQTNEPETQPDPIRLVAATRPQYPVEELTEYRETSPEIALIFATAQTALGKFLNYNDMNIVFSFYDWLRLPSEVILYLLEYCAENGHRTLRYIEKCALDWVDNDIQTREQAENYVLNFDKNYRTVLHYMGQTSAYPTPSHRKFIDKWLDLWQMPMDIIMEACDRSVAETGKPKFSYVDKILQNWNKKDIRDIQAVKAAEEEFKREKEKAANAPVAANITRPSRFVNFAQRENDHSHFEELDRALLQQELRQANS